MLALIPSIIARHRIARIVVIFLAKFLIWLMGAWIAIMMLQQRTYPILLWSSVSVIVALSIQQLVALFWFRQRPFVQEPGWPNLIHASAHTKSFPSDHAAAAFALATSISIADPSVMLFWYGLALLVTVGRYLAGVHYISDLIVGALIGSVIASGVMFFVSQVWTPMYTPLY